MDEAITRHLECCKRGNKCPCRALEIDRLEDELHEMELSVEVNRPWIREKLQILLPTLKTIEPWLEIIDTVAQANPISGQVSGLVKVAMKVDNFLQVGELFEHP